MGSCWGIAHGIGFTELLHIIAHYYSVIIHHSNLLLFNGWKLPAKQLRQAFLIVGRCLADPKAEHVGSPVHGTFCVTSSCMICRDFSGFSWEWPSFFWPSIFCFQSWNINAAQDLILLAAKRRRRSRFCVFFLWLGKVPKAKERCNQEAWMTSGYMLLTFDVAFDDVGVFFLSWTCFFDPSLKRDLDGTPGTCQTSSHGQELLRQPGSQKMMYGNEILGLKSLNEGLPRSRRYPSPIWTPDSPWDPGELHQVLDSQNGWFI